MKIAVTGGIGEGKSTVLAELAQLGYRTASADQIAREVFDDPAVQERISKAAHLPMPLDRELLRAAFAQDESLRRRVNEITHPRILANLLTANAIFVEVPLLFETCIQEYFDQVWVVTCGAEEQRRRLEARYHNPLHVEQMLATQLKTSTKTTFADKIIRTNQSQDYVRRLLTEAVKTLLVA